MLIVGCGKRCFALWKRPICEEVRCDHRSTSGTFLFPSKPPVASMAYRLGCPTLSWHRLASLPPRHRVSRRSQILTQLIHGSCHPKKRRTVSRIVNLLFCLVFSFAIPFLCIICVCGIDVCEIFVNSYFHALLFSFAEFFYLSFSFKTGPPNQKHNYSCLYVTSIISYINYLARPSPDPLSISTLCSQS